MVYGRHPAEELNKTPITRPLLTQNDHALPLHPNLHPITFLCASRYHHFFIVFETVFVKTRDEQLLWSVVTTTMDGQLVNDLVKQVSDENELLIMDIADLDNQVDLLQNYRQKCISNMAVKESIMVAGEECIKLALESMMKLIPVDSVRTEEHLSKHLNDHEDIQMPHTQGSATGKCHCPGCGMEFKLVSEYFEMAYYIHCIKECDEYLRLDLIKKV